MARALSHAVKEQNWIEEYRKNLERGHYRIARKIVDDNMNGQIGDVRERAPVCAATYDYFYELVRDRDCTNIGRLINLFPEFGFGNWIPPAERTRYLNAKSDKQVGEKRK